MRDPRSDDRISMRVNPVRCEGVGICAHLAPDVITLDKWGFPVLPADGLADDQIAQARRAVAGCPRTALQLDQPA